MVTRMPRDIRCAESVGEMARLGKFDREFTVYGCAYQEKNEILYRISEHEETIYRFCEKSRLNGVYPTAVLSHTQRTGVPSGMEAAIWQEEQWNLAHLLQESFSDGFLNLLQQLHDKPSANGAYKMLQQWQERLEGRFRRDWLQVFDCYAEYCFMAKKLDKESYAQLKQWSAYNWKQMEDDIIIKDIYERTLHGILYEVDGGLQGDYDAQYATVYRKQQQLISQGILVTPVYSKTCWFRTFTDFSKIKEQYVVHMRELLEPCISFMRQVAELPSFISVEEFAEIYTKVKAQGTQAEVDTLNLYGHRWGCLK